MNLNNISSKTFDYMLAIVGIVLTIITWNYSPDIQIGWALPMIIIILLISVLVINHYKRRENIIQPEVISAKESYNDDSELLCLIKPSKLFFQDMLVSFYYKDHSGFEELIGIGRVLNIQDDNIIQVEMTKSIERYDDIITRLKQNNKDMLLNLKIKHNVPQQELYSSIFRDID